jgi:hypothetical protein
MGLMLVKTTRVELEERNDLGSSREWAQLLQRQKRRQQWTDVGFFRERQQL